MARVMKALMLVCVLIVPIAGCVAPSFTGNAAASYDATIRWSAYGIPHITASDWGGLGYGYGYAAATDHLCVIAEEYVTVAGERSRHFDPDGTYMLTSNGQTYTNVQSDLYFTLLKENSDLVASIADYPRDELQAVLAGYVAGYNRYLADTPPHARPADCADAEWVRPITRDDMVQRVNKLNLIASMGFFAPHMVNARPPLPETGATAAAPLSEAHVALLAQRLPTSDALGLGSNGYAFGSDVTANGRGMLMGNPHFPWSGPERFHQLHLTIPGKVDVMGSTLLGVPLVLIGFTEHVAWTHTVSTGWRFSLHELRLVPGDPTAYVVDGDIERMTTRSVTVDTGEGSATHDFHFSRYGPIVDFALAEAAGIDVGLTWDATRAYALHDMNAGNDRTAEQFYRFNTAKSFDEFVDAMQETHGIPWVNTVAASPDGRTLYADMSVVPNYDADKILRCNTPVGRALFEAARLPVFDGSRSECMPTHDARAAQPGIIPSDEMPMLVTTAWVINSNDDHWLPHPDHRLEGHSPMIGKEQSERNGRTRMGYQMFEERFSGQSDCGIDADVACDKMTLARLQESLFDSRVYWAEHALDAVLDETCALPLAIASDGRPVALTEACHALASWDRSATAESAGLPLFELFWLQTVKTWRVPFTPDEPTSTPRGFIGTDPRVAQALADAALMLQGAGLALDVTAGDARATQRGGERIPLHGASGALGSPNMLVVPFEPDVGFLEPIHGNSYIQTVTWDEAGRPVAEAVLSYSQSPHAESSHHADQTRLYSQKQWVALPFAEADVAAQTVRTLRLV